MIKLALLGHGPFAKPSFSLLKQHYEIVEQENADCLIVANYGKILTKEELAKPTFGAVNIHGSALPAYRGASPIQTAIANGDKETGVTIIKMDELVDHGTILGQRKIEIDKDDTTETLRTKLGLLAAPLLLEVLTDYLKRNVSGTVQNHEQATFTKKVSTEDSLAEPSLEPNKLYNLYRAYKDEPGFFVKLEDNQTLKILEAEFSNGQFIPLQVQRPGKNPVSYKNFLLGYRNKPPFMVDTKTIS